MSHDTTTLQHAAATSIQALFRAHRIRKLFPKIEMDFEAIVQEIEGFEENAKDRIQRRVLVQWRDFECFGDAKALRRPVVSYIMSGTGRGEKEDSSERTASRSKYPEDSQPEDDEALSQDENPNPAPPQPASFQKLKYLRARAVPKQEEPPQKPPKQQVSQPPPHVKITRVERNTDSMDDDTPTVEPDNTNLSNTKVSHQTPSKPPLSTSPPSKLTPGPHSSDIHVDSQDLFVVNPPLKSQTPVQFRSILKKSQLGSNLDSSLDESRDSFDSNSDDDSRDDIRMSTAMSQYRSTTEKPSSTTLDDFLRKSTVSDVDKEKLAHQVELLITEEALKKRKAILREKARRQFSER